MADPAADHGNSHNQVGYGSAAAVVLFMVSLVIVLIYQCFVLRRDMAERSPQGKGNDRPSRSRSH
ncbi:hypothetical protein [Nesterenkonia ebinurensis]|uniref:hypothetical protein n=1 Tax=Nesterenkonia ebinurensis TaxID=2608252 RepID=UPI00295E6D57|nr:hypothetical protein [Nesterenkonia ebinurensis]